MTPNTARRLSAGLLLGAALVCAQEPKPARTIGAPAPAQWEIPDDPAAKPPVECRVRISGFELHPTEHGEVVALPSRVPGLSQAGAPDLPAVASGFKGHPQVRLAVRFLRSEFEDVPDVDVAPVPSARAGEFDQPYEKPVLTYSRSPDAYAADAWWPETLVSLQEAMGGTQKYVRVECRPFQYNAARRTLRFHRQIEFALEVKRD